MQVFRIPQKCGWTKVILITLPKTNSSHLSGVSWPQKETHPSNPTSQFFLFKSRFFSSGSYQRWYSDDVWARDEGQTAAGEDCREGISGFSIEESNLRPWILIGECWAPNASGTLGVWSTTSISAGSAWCTLRVLESLWRFLIITPLDTLRDLICEKKQVGPRSELMSCIYFSFKKLENLKNCNHSLPIDAKVFKKLIVSCAKQAKTIQQTI